MKTLYKNATLITQNQTREIVSDGYVGVENGVITYVDADVPAGSSFDDVIDLEGRWLLPGFVNPHVHLGESVYFSSLTQKLSLNGYIDATERIYAANTIIGESRDAACMFSLHQLIKNGSTAIAGGRVHDTAGKIEMPNTSGYMLMSSNKLGHYSADALNKFIDLHTQEGGHDVYHVIFIHSLSRVGVGELRVVQKLKEQLEDLVVMLHIAEDQNECDAVQEKWGIGSIEVLHKYGLLDKNTMLVHGNHLNADDLDAIAQANASICHCLTSNMTTADAVLDLKEVVARGINTVIGTDGPITGAGFDILNETRKVYQYQNKFHDNEVIAPQDCLDMITVNAAHAIGQKDAVGSVEVGKLANFVLFDPPLELESRSIVDFLVRYDLAKVSGVTLRGEKVVWNGELLFDDAVEIQRQFSDLVKSIE